MGTADPALTAHPSGGMALAVLLATQYRYAFPYAFCIKYMLQVRPVSIGQLEAANRDRLLHPLTVIGIHLRLEKHADGLERLDLALD